MRKIYLKISILLVMFAIGVGIDYELRHRRTGVTDCFCSSAKCRIVTFADNPGLFFESPTEALREILTAEFWD